MDEASHKPSDRFFWLVFAITLGVYLAMVVWSIPQISREAGGLPVFDMRPGGYTFEEAKAFLNALSPAGAEFYANVQHRLDMAYPALLAVILFWGIFRLAPIEWGRFRWVPAATAIPGSFFDYWENADVAAMLEKGADDITAEGVQAASSHSQLKAAFSTVSITILLLLLAMWAYRRWRSRREPG